jgi:hypothetical protein
MLLQFVISFWPAFIAEHIDGSFCSREDRSTSRASIALCWTVRLDSLKLSSDPSGSLSNLRLAVPFDLVALRAV